MYPVYDKEKIRMMAKLAVYDKRGFDKDTKTSQYFRHDYIYKKNMQMRFFLGIGCLILAFFYVMYLLGVDGADIFALNFQAEALRLLIFVIIVMVAYSFLGTIIYTREFLLSQRRINAYFSYMRRLNGEETEAETEAKYESEADEEDFYEQPAELYYSVRNGHNEYEHSDEEEDDFEEFEPYRRLGDTGYEYKYQRVNRDEAQDDNLGSGQDDNPDDITDEK